jgi:hypothetical protein
MADLAMVQPNSSGRLAAGMLALGLVAGCGGDGRVQELPPGAFDADALPELAFVEELRIGSVDDPDAGFSRIGAVTTLPDGRVLVLEALDRQVRIYGAEGRLERTIGRAGDGPGEFQGPLRFGMLADTLWVADLGSGRITLLDLEGRVLETLRADPVPVDVGIDGIRGLAHPARLRPDGLVETDWRMTAGNDVEADSIFWPELLLDRAGAVVDTLRMNRHPWPPTPMARIGTFSFGLSPPLPDGPLHAALGEDRFTLERPAATAPGEAAFTLVREGPAGDTLLQRAFTYRPRPVPPEWREERIAELTALNARAPDGPPADAIERAVREGLPFPDHIPPVVELHVGEEGHAWLRREDVGDTHHRWVVVRPDGTPLGVVRIPRGARIAASRGDLAWIVDRDAFEVPWLVRIRVLEDP